MPRGDRKVCQLKLVEEHTNATLKYRRLTHGQPNKEKSTKTILLIGGTGEGKSTMINSIANFLLGVKYEDDNRYSVTDESLHADQTVSQTTWITKYVIYHQASFPETFNYNMCIIDTPGFGDTSGIEADQQITNRLKDLLGMEGDEGIDVVDVLGFVMRSSHTRLTQELKYVFHSILSIFANDVNENIFIFATFSDGRKPAVLSALKKEDIPYKVVYRFDNGVLYPDADDDYDEDGDEVARMAWNQNYRHFLKLLSHIGDIMPMRLRLTREVLFERQQLEDQLEALQKKMTEKVELMAVQEQQKIALECHKKSMGRNQAFKNTIIKTKIVRVPLEGKDQGTRAMNCDKCESTCHWPCRVPIDSLAGTCTIFSLRECVICKCSPSTHNMYNYRLETQSYTVETTMAEMKASYDTASRRASAARIELDRVAKDIQSTKAVMEEMLNRASESMNRLNRISLRPHVMSRSDYINWLIANERSNKSEGWEDRVKGLQSMLDTARCKSAFRKDARRGATQ